MAMALKQDVMQACREAGTEKPIDLVYLSRLTMGDPALERDLLKMFASQIEVYIDSVRRAASEQEVYAIAHTIKGAARSVGALRLSEIAGKAEKDREFDIEILSSEMEAIATYIRELG